MSAARGWSVLASYCVLAAALLLLSACSAPAHGADRAQAAGGDAAKFAFRSSVDEAPAGWTGPVFALSHDYPAADPGTCATDLCTWLGRDVDFSVDFTAPRPTWEDPIWNQYIQDILDYVAEGQDRQSRRRSRLSDGGRRRNALVPCALDGVQPPGGA